MPTSPILLLDDDPFALKLLTHQLARAEITSLDAVTSGPQALALLDEKTAAYELLFLDLNMPGMDGVEFVRHLVMRRYAGALVLVSGEDPRTLETAERLARAHRLNVLGHLTKPVQPDSLTTLIELWRVKAPPQVERRRKRYGADELRRAIVRKELVSFYQPKVELATGALCGVEALVRWRHPEDGLVFPDQFIDAIEEHGLIDELTRVVLTEALGQVRRWRDAGLALRVAVNISMDNLKRLDFVEFVVNELNRHRVAASELVLEVTESRLMEDVLAPLDILTRLRLKRVTLSIDDFGTGHSSLAQLRDLPFDELKVDRGFVHAACSDKTRRVILGASLGLARQLSMRAVAEGVENEADWVFLREQGCDLAQGYFIARPMPADELPAWLAEWEARRPALTR